MKEYSKILLLFVCLLSLSSFHNTQENDIIGEWLTQKKDGKINIYKKGDKYYGNISWLKEPNEKDGTPKKDTKNPNKSLRDQTILGLELLRNFKYVGNNIWEDGKIYDPESGSDYSCVMTLKDKNTLEVRGYIGFSWIGRTEVWTK